MDEPEVPPVRKLRWPILVALDAQSGDAVLDLEARVAAHIDVSDEARTVIDPDTGRPVLTQRMMQAIDDLYQADAVEIDEEAGVVRITDVGRRLTEPEAEGLSVTVGADETDAGPTDPGKPSIGDWIAALLDVFSP